MDLYKSAQLPRQPPTTTYYTPPWDSPQLAQRARAPCLIGANDAQRNISIHRHRSLLRSPSAMLLHTTINEETRTELIDTVGLHQ